MAGLEPEIVRDAAAWAHLRQSLADSAPAADLDEAGRALEASGTRGGACVVVVREDRTLVGAMLLCTQADRIVSTLPLTEVRVGTRTQPVFAVAGRHTDVARAAAEGLALPGAPTWDVLVSEPVPIEGSGIETLAEVLAEGGRRAYIQPERAQQGRPFGRLRAFNSTPAGLLARAFASVKRRAGAARAALELGESTTGEAVRRAASRMAAYRSLHLYRGELFVRERQSPSGIDLALITLADFDARSDRGELCARLSLDEAYAREKWRRGDTVVLAQADGRPVGILWCAHAPVRVPEIGRDVRPGPGECYIHDVYVTPDARGRAVAPAMLDFLARELRGRDVYRAWALIERSNTASTRAFEKAAYASIADVTFARVGGATKLLVRPPDPAARAFLGLPAE
jgi:ribosomal protein S18 acetylase RimI-like enzyme